VNQWIDGVMEQHCYLNEKIHTDNPFSIILILRWNYFMPKKTDKKNHDRLTPEEIAQWKQLKKSLDSINE